jgi:hypothetical protein
MAIQSSDNSLQLYNATDGLIALSVSTNGVVTAPYGLTATNGLATTAYVDAATNATVILVTNIVAGMTGPSGSNFISAARLAGSNYLTGLFTNANQFGASSALTIKDGVALTNILLGSSDGIWADVFSAQTVRIRPFSLLLQPTNNLLLKPNSGGAIDLITQGASDAITIGPEGGAPIYLRPTYSTTAGYLWTTTNIYGAGHWAPLATNGLASSTTLNSFSVANSNLSYAVGTASTNYTLAASNNLSALAYTIGANGTNYTDVKSSNNVMVVVGTGPGTITTAGSSGIQTYTINFPATNGYVDQTITNGLATTAYVNAATNATVILATNIFANLSGPSQSNFISSVRLAGSNYVTASITNGLATTAYVDAATNTPLITVASNVVRQIVTQLAATNTTANTNITLNFNQGAQVLYTTNNFSITNFAGLSSTSGEKNITLRVMAQGTITVVYPTLGAPSFGVYAWTNANAPMWTTLTNGKAYIISITAQDTNLFSTITLWQ